MCRFGSAFSSLLLSHITFSFPAFTTPDSICSRPRIFFSNTLPSHSSSKASLPPRILLLPTLSIFPTLTHIQFFYNLPYDHLLPLPFLPHHAPLFRLFSTFPSPSDTIVPLPFSSVAISPLPSTSSGPVRLRSVSSICVLTLAITTPLILFAYPFLLVHLTITSPKPHHHPLLLNPPLPHLFPALSQSQSPCSPSTMLLFPSASLCHYHNRQFSFLSCFFCSIMTYLSATLQLPFRVLSSPSPPATLSFASFLALPLFSSPPPDFSPPSSLTLPFPSFSR